MKAILNGTTLKISAETEQEGQDLQVWLDKNIGREGDMEFKTSISCGDCDNMLIDGYDSSCGLMSHFEDGAITETESKLEDCPL